MKPFIIQALLLFATCYSSPSSETNIVIAKGFIGKLCADKCQSKGKAVEDCERGCRFFDYAETSGLTKDFNSSAFHLLCTGSCDEAYTETKREEACVSGCDSAKQELTNILEMSAKLVEEANKQMNFMDSIFDMMSSTFWTDDDKDIEFARPFNGFDFDAKPHALDKDGELMSHLNEETLCATRLWLHRLSFILIVMGSLSLFLVSFFYLLAYMKQKKVRGQVIVSDLNDPPSYETLVKSGCIIIAPNDVVEKKEKLISDN